METLKVVIRVRPLNKKEIESNHFNVWNIDSENNCLSSDTQTTRRYSFDRVYSPCHTTKDIYNESMSPVIQSFVNGFNGTIFAYGQTSSGKTYTMMGSGGPRDDGVIHKAIKYIFRIIGSTTEREFALKVSYLEIYNESIKDLLVPQNVDLKISMDNFHRPVVRGLSTESITEQEQIFRILKYGMTNRNVGATKMNAQSSRSHTIFQITLESRQLETCSEFDGSVRSSVLNIVDLAGSERQKKTDASGQRLKEGCNINKSLLTLGIVIQKLCDISRGKGAGGHIPYRDSKLTHILEPALGGNSKTVVICTITPADIHHEETVSTLGFASRAKEVTNNAHVEEIIDEAAMIKRQKQQIAELQRRLNNNNNNNNTVHHTDTDTKDGFATERAEYEKQIARLKALCRTNPHKPTDVDGNEMNVNNHNNNIKKKKSVLGKRRRHSVAIDLDGTPARKRLKTQLIQNQPRTRHSSFATPLNKARIQNDEMALKLRKAANISKGLQQELSAKYRDFSDMQMEIDRLNEINSIQSQKIEFFESSMSDDHVMENQRLTLENNELKHKMESLNGKLSKYEDREATQEKKEIECKLRSELEHSHTTIEELQSQIAELRLNIEQQQKLAESIKENTSSSREMSVDGREVSRSSGNGNVLFQMNVSKLQSQLILIKNDKAWLQQMVSNEAQKWISFQNECLRPLESKLRVCAALNDKVDLLQRALEESNDEKRLFESEYHQIREERDEMRGELDILRRPENEIMDELQSELLNMQKQSDIDSAHTLNMKQQLEEKVNENSDLQRLNEELTAMMKGREKEMDCEWNVKMNALQQELTTLKQLNEKLEHPPPMTSTTFNINKMDSMNVSQLRDALKTMKRFLREQKSKMSAMERKRDVYEKTASKYNKRRGELEERLKKLSREHNHTKSQLLSTQKLNKRLKTKNDKLQMNIKKMQNEAVNEKDLSRKLNIMSKRFDSVQRKYDAKSAEVENLKQLTQQNEISLATMKETRNKFENSVRHLEKENGELSKALSTEKDVVLMLQTELKKFHQINGEQSEELTQTKRKMAEYEEEIVNELQPTLKRVQQEFSDAQNKCDTLASDLSESKENWTRLQQQNECLKVSLSAMKETDCIQRNEIDETNKLLRESQSELNENKKELREYQNKWQRERKANDEHIEKLRTFELKTNTLSHEKQMNLCSIESKTKEIERLNTHAKEQQQMLLRTISECADYKTRCDAHDNEMEKLKEEQELLLAEKEGWMVHQDNKQKQWHEMRANHLHSTQQLEMKEKQLSDAQMEIADLKHNIESQTKKGAEWQQKYQELKQNHHEVRSELDAQQSQCTDLEDKLTQCQNKIAKNQTQLRDATDGLCDLQRELDIKRECENERNALQIKYSELLSAYQASESQLTSQKQKMMQSETKLRTMTDELQQISLQNEQLRDDNRNYTTLQQKYAKAKEYCTTLKEEYAKANGYCTDYSKQVEKLKKREAKYENAILEWKKYEKKAQCKMDKQESELKNLRPSKAKARRFQKLCDEYHYAKNQIFKANCICRETQTYEIRLENKENINHSNKKMNE